MSTAGLKIWNISSLNLRCSSGLQLPAGHACVQSLLAVPLGFLAVWQLEQPMEKKDSSQKPILERQGGSFLGSGSGPSRGPPRQRYTSPSGGSEVRSGWARGYGGGGYVFAATLSMAPSISPGS